MRTLHNRHFRKLFGSKLCFLETLQFHRFQNKNKNVRNFSERTKMGKSKGVKKHRKTEIVFDESKRRDFLTGFRKRKEERRQKAKAEQETKIKAEIKLAK